MKQTVEENNKMFLALGNDEHDGIDGEEERGFLLGVQTGIKWQKEQGIDWINVEEKKPVIPENETWVNVLISNGVSVAKCDYSRAGFQIFPKPFLITHFAYINLPK